MINTYSLHWPGLNTAWKWPEPGPCCTTTSIKTIMRRRRQQWGRQRSGGGGQWLCFYHFSLLAGTPPHPPRHPGPEISDTIRPLTGEHQWWRWRPWLSSRPSFSLRSAWRSPGQTCLSWRIWRPAGWWRRALDSNPDWTWWRRKALLSKSHLLDT